MPDNSPRLRMRVRAICSSAVLLGSMSGAPLASAQVSSKPPTAKPATPDTTKKKDPTAPGSARLTTPADTRASTPPSTATEAVSQPALQPPKGAPAVAPLPPADVKIDVYHGRDETGFMTFGNGNIRKVVQKLPKTFHPAGTVVCFDVLNALTAGYKYAVEAEVDATEPPLPDITKFAAAIASALKAATTADGRLPRLDGYAAKVSTLSAEVDSAIAIARAADEPEELALISAPADQRKHGLAFARTRLAVLKDSLGHFNSPTLAADVEAWYNEFAPDSGENKILYEALHSLGISLVNAATRIKLSYMAGPLSTCPRGTVGAGTTTFTLRVAPAEGGTTRIRDSQKDAAYAVLVNESPFERSRVELTPVVFLASAFKDVPNFSVRADNTLAETRSGASGMRAGTMLHLNAWEFGQAKDWVMSVGAGVGVGGDNSIVSDILGALTLGYRKFGRVGFGFGGSRFARGLKGTAQIGQPLPAGTKLDDVIDTALVGSYHVILSLPGIAGGDKKDEKKQ